MIKFISDPGSNHNGSFDRACALIDASKEIGCWGVKFQLFKSEKLWHSSYPDQLSIAKKREIPLNWISELSDYCKNININFGLSVFYEEAIDEVKEYVDFFKISSYDILRKSLIIKCLETKKPLIISTGLATQIDLFYMADITKDTDNIVYLHCVSDYPTKAEDCNMETISQLHKICMAPIGWSDHTVQPGVIYQSIVCGANVIEFHLDLDDGFGCESCHHHCWRRYKIKDVIRTVRVMEIANGSKSNYILARSNQNMKEKRKWMADISDGLRPLKEYR